MFRLAEYDFFGANGYKVIPKKVFTIAKVIIGILVVGLIILLIRVILPTAPYKPITTLNKWHELGNQSNTCLYRNNDTLETYRSWDITGTSCKDDMCININQVYDLLPVLLKRHRYRTNFVCTTMLQNITQVLPCYCVLSLQNGTIFKMSSPIIIKMSNTLFNISYKLPLLYNDHVFADNIPSFIIFSYNNIPVELMLSGKDVNTFLRALDVLSTPSYKKMTFF